MILAERLAQHEREHEFLRRHTIPEEDRHRHTSAKWAGEYRWFRASNVICLEKVRLLCRECSTLNKVTGAAPAL
jgi:hypothetical protein